MVTPVLTEVAMSLPTNWVLLNKQGRKLVLPKINSMLKICYDLFVKPNPGDRQKYVIGDNYMICIRKWYVSKTWFPLVMER